MLAVFGFCVTGILFWTFAYTLPKQKDKKLQARFTDYKLAYLLLSITFLGYGIASAINEPDALAFSMIFGNVTLLVATLYMLRIRYSKKVFLKPLLVAMLLAGVGAIAVRAVYFYPEPYIQDSILVFNSQRAVSFVMSAVFLLIWLPVNLQMATQLVVNAKAESLNRTYSMLYMSATFAAVIFLLAKKPATLALSFTALSIAFLVLTISNIMLYRAKAEVKKHGRK